MKYYPTTSKKNIYIYIIIDTKYNNKYSITVTCVTYTTYSALRLIMYVYMFATWYLILSLNTICDKYAEKQVFFFECVCHQMKL